MCQKSTTLSSFGKGYKGATETTRELLNYWFYTDHHFLTSNKFRYHDAQQEAIEILVYVDEVKKVRRRQSLLEGFSFDNKDLRLPSDDEFARYCLKMATGSGKTKVMALAIVWQYFNAVREDDKQYAKTFLILAPNVIVFERLKEDFINGKIFQTDPLFPRHFKMFWELECYMRGDAQRTHSDGALYLTNIQQFYERVHVSKEEEPTEITALLGNKPQTKKLEITDFADRIAQHDGLLMPSRSRFVIFSLIKPLVKKSIYLIVQSFKPCQPIWQVILSLKHLKKYCVNKFLKKYNQRC